MPVNQRRHHLVLMGATGFVGRQTVASIGAQARGSGLRWAVAGRNRAKLEQVLRDAGDDAAGAGIVVADADDSRALNSLARSAEVVLSTAGPFDLYGSKLVAACVRHATHYVDITGETPWVQRVIAQHHTLAKDDGTRIIPCCGFDSVPSDLGAWMMVQAMQQRHGVGCVDVQAAFSVRGGLNGGTLASALNMLAKGESERLADPFLLNPQGTRPADTKRHADPLLPRLDPDLKAWLAPFVMGPINTRVVRRSAALLDYGTGFHYQEYLRIGAGALAGMAAASLSGGMQASRAAMGFAGVRAMAARFAPKPGEGPSESTMDGGSFRCELLAKSASGHVLRGRIADTGDPGNRATTKMVCAAALALVLDRDSLPPSGGVLTPASGLGPVLLERLRAAGMTLQVDS
ncbi:MAG: saccharopine dehydrogenase NADP-binding domain-containing protein [Burkholderiaceae bacterium]